MLIVLEMLTISENRNKRGNLLKNPNHIDNLRVQTTSRQELKWKELIYYRNHREGMLDIPESNDDIRFLDARDFRRSEPIE